MKFSLAIISLLIITSPIRAQSRFTEYASIIDQELSEVNRPDSLLLFINPVAFSWGNQYDWSQVLLFVFKKNGYWSYKAIRITQRGEWQSKSISTVCSFPIAAEHRVELWFYECKEAIKDIMASRGGEHTGYYVSLMSRCNNEVLEVPFYNAPGPGHMAGFANSKYNALYDLYAYCTVNAAGFDFKEVDRKRMKKK